MTEHIVPQTGEARLRELETLVEWQGDELSKRMACVNCGEEPHPDSELYSTVCPSCRMCFSCCEPMCPTCGDLDGTKQRAIDLRNENQRLIAEVERLRSAGSAKPETAGFMEIQNALVNAGIYVGFGYTSDGVLKAYPSPTVSAGSAQAPETPPKVRVGDDDIDALTFASRCMNDVAATLDRLVDSNNSGGSWESAGHLRNRVNGSLRSLARGLSTNAERIALAASSSDEQAEKEQ